MKLTNLEVRKDKNKNLYLYVAYEDKKGKERHKCLNHYDLEYAMKGKIKYETSKSQKTNG